LQVLHERTAQADAQPEQAASVQVSTKQTRRGAQLERVPKRPYYDVGQLQKLVSLSNSLRESNEASVRALRRLRYSQAISPGVSSLDCSGALGGSA
jgi:hypothetical protein